MPRSNARLRGAPSPEGAGRGAIPAYGTLFINLLAVKYGGALTRSRYKTCSTHCKPRKNLSGAESGATGKGAVTLLTVLYGPLTAPAACSEPYGQVTA